MPNKKNNQPQILTTVKLAQLQRVRGEREGERERGREGERESQRASAANILK